MNGGKIGEAFVELRAKVDKLEAELTQAKARVNEYASAAESAHTRTQQSAETASRGIGQALKQQMTAFTGLISRVSAAIGVFTVFLQLGERIREMFTSGAEKAERFSESIAGQDAQARVAALAKQLGELEAKLSQVREATWLERRKYANMDGETEASLVEQITELRKSEAATRQQINTKAIRDREKAEEESRQKEIAASIQARDEVSEMILGSISEVETARRESLDRQAEDERKFAEAAMRAQEELADEILRSRQQTAEQVRGEVRSARQELEAWRRQLNERGGATDIRRLARAIHVASLRNMGR